MPINRALRLPVAIRGGRGHLESAGASVPGELVALIPASTASHVAQYRRNLRRHTTTYHRYKKHCWRRHQRQEEGHHILRQVEERHILRQVEERHILLQAEEHRNLLQVEEHRNLLQVEERHILLQEEERHILHQERRNLREHAVSGTVRSRQRAVGRSVDTSRWATTILRIGCGARIRRRCTRWRCSV